MKFVRGEPKYHVKWKGYDETSWEPESNLHCPELLNKFKAAQLQEARALKKKATRKADLPDRGSHVTAKIPAEHQEDSEGLEEVYEVEKILRETFRFGLSYFEVKWKGYSQTSWEPASNLNCPDKLEKFRRRQKAARQPMLENSAPAEVTDATGTVGHDSPRKDTDENEKPSGGSTARQASRASIPENNGVVTNDADNVATESRQTDDRNENVATESRQTDDRNENDYEYDYPNYFPETTEEEAISNAGGGVEPWGDGISNNADADATPVPRADSRGSGKAPRKRKSPRQTAETTAT
ncbi:hypothetical protein PR001_g31757, partial [Phytophthora rubi]